ncbi:uncharacterized protein LOC127094956 [Lathyrus oleraceus]|uniref:uncharacterized protein LOC127094956 n=1 Tax=Pisum sativum TaxID=3888 RepID=UPI0021D1A72F|nr:uncharacterized protein LOC127094956 [Pisum sativum]
MEGPPEEKFLEAFLLHDLGVENPTLFARIKKAWEKVNRKGKADLGKKNCITKEPYFQWIKERVRSIKMPFKIEMFGPLPESKPTHVPIEEAEGLRASLEKLTRENEELLKNLHLITNEKNEFKWKLERNKAQLQVNVEKVDKEEYKRKRVKHGLDQADSCLNTVKSQLKKAERDCREKEKWWKLTTKQKKEIRETLEAEISNLSVSLCEAKEREERERRSKESALAATQVTPEMWKGKCQEVENANEWERYRRGRHDSLLREGEDWMNARENVNASLAACKETIQFLHEQRNEYRDKFASLIDFCNDMANNVPLMLRCALEDIDNDNIPHSMTEFIYLCEDMFREEQAAFREEMDSVKIKIEQIFEAIQALARREEDARVAAAVRNDALVQGVALQSGPSVPIPNPVIYGLPPGFVPPPERNHDSTCAYFWSS